MQLTPAEYVIYAFGGVRATARAIGRAPASVCKWQKDRHNGLRGIIPHDIHRKILEVAKQKNKDITPNDLIYGRFVKGAYE
jgi:hypothetical protein